MNYKILLNNKTVLLQGTPKDILLKSLPKRKGIDMRLYAIDGASNKDTQTVASFLCSMSNPDPQYKKSQEDIDRVLSEALDKVLIADRVKSANDYYTVNDKTDSYITNSMNIVFDEDRVIN